MRAKTAEVCRRHGISSATFHSWKSRYGGMEISDVKRLKALEDEIPPALPASRRGCVRGVRTL